MFAALYIPDLPVEAVVRMHGEPGLREKAVAVLEGKPPLERVVAANERARLLGVEAGMTRLQVEEFAAPVTLLRRAPEQEAAAHAALIDAACVFSPRVEDTAADTLVLDLAGLETLFGPPAKIARELARRASELGVEAHVAVAANPDAAVYIARGFAGVTIVAEDQTAERLGLLEVEVLAREAERREDLDGAPPVERFAEVMERWGIRKLRPFANLPSVAVVERLGQRGLTLQQLARGARRRTLAPLEPPLEFEETIELEYPVENLEPLAFLLNRMLEHLCARLGARSLATNELRFTCELDALDETENPPQRHRDTEKNKKGKEMVSSVPEPAPSEVEGCLCGEKIFERTLKLPVPMRDAKVLLKLLQLDLAAHPPGAPVKKVVLRAEPVKPRATQGGFFVPVTPEPEKLELLLARVAALVGEVNVGAVEVQDSHRPDAHRMKRFSVSGFQFPERRAGNGKQETGNAGARLALRLYRPPLRARVEVQGSKPARVSFLAVARAEVLACAGPWRTSGEWWTNEGWQRDEWDVAVRTKDGTALYRMYRDAASGEWFVFGSYD
jgi:protein ImuB